MSQPNITPIYGLWLKENSALYQYHSVKARKLEVDLKELDTGSTGSNQKLTELYQEFLSMFCNSMHRTAFGIPDGEITTSYLKAYLVRNEYGVMTPWAMMEEHRKQADYDMKISEAPVTQVIGKIDMGVLELYKKQYEFIKKVNDIPHKRKPALSTACFTLLLALTSYLGLAMNLHNIILDFSSVELAGFWLIILVLILVLTYKTIRELYLFVQWKAYKINIVWLEKKRQDIEENAGKIPSFVMEYSNKIKKELEQKQTKLPQQQRSIEQYKAEIMKRISRVILFSKNYKRAERGLRFFAPMLMLIISIFLFYATWRPDYREWLNKKAYLSNEQQAMSYQSGKEREETIKEIKVLTCQSSSSLKGKSTGVTYSGKFTIDGKLNTCWQEGKKGSGIGESVRYEFDDNYSLSKLKIWNGRAESPLKYKENNRIKEFEITFFLNKQEKLRKVFSLKDEYTSEGTMLSIESKEGVRCDQVKLKILSVYNGSKYDDTCLTDILFYESEYQ